MAQPVLEIRNATKVYRTSGGFLSPKKEVVALENYSLTIDKNPASITTIAGESGSGKTTLANVVLGFTPLTAGQILFHGQDLATMNPAAEVELPAQCAGRISGPLRSLQSLLPH